MLAIDPEGLEQLRLFIEELCCDLCRFRHVDTGARPQGVRIWRELSLGQTGAFADVFVVPPSDPPYFLEVKLGLSRENVIAHLKRKYGPGSRAVERASRLVLVVDAQRLGASLEDDMRAILGGGDASLVGQIRAAIDPALSLEVWDEGRLASLIQTVFGVELGALGIDDIQRVRAAVEAAKAKHAFGRSGPDSLEQSLLWHFGYWRLGELQRQGKLEPEKLLAPGMYRNVTVLLADLCSFSSYVRDTRDDGVVRHCLTSFYSKARYAILNSGGLLYNFVGDEVIALFGIPDEDGRPAAALECAEALLDIGQSVSYHWQRHIDRVQKTAGLHVGIATGDLQIVPLRPYSPSQWGVVGDGINLGCRLMGVAGADEIVVSNAFYRQLPESAQSAFSELPDLDAKNVGSIRAWSTRRAR